MSKSMISLAGAAAVTLLAATSTASFASPEADVAGGGDKANSAPAPTIDSNSDGKADAWDRNGDGKADAWDRNGDGKPDAYDDDNDGQPDAAKPEAR